MCLGGTISERFSVFFSWLCSYLIPFSNVYELLCNCKDKPDKVYVIFFMFRFYSSLKALSSSSKLSKTYAIFVLFLSSSSTLTIFSYYRLRPPGSTTQRVWGGCLWLWRFFSSALLPSWISQAFWIVECNCPDTARAHPQKYPRSLCRRGIVRLYSANFTRLESGPWSDRLRHQFFSVLSVPSECQPDFYEYRPCAR